MGYSVNKELLFVLLCMLLTERAGANSVGCLIQPEVVANRIQEPARTEIIVTVPLSEFSVDETKFEHIGSSPPKAKFAKDFILDRYETNIEKDPKGVLRIKNYYGYPKYDNVLVPQRDIACAAAWQMEKYPYVFKETVVLKGIEEDAKLVNCSFEVHVKPRETTMARCRAEAEATLNALKKDAASRKAPK